MLRPPNRKGQILKEHEAAMLKLLRYCMFYSRCIIIKFNVYNNVFVLHVLVFGYNFELKYVM